MDRFIKWINRKITKAGKKYIEREKWEGGARKKSVRERKKNLDYWVIVHFFHVQGQRDRSVGGKTHQKLTTKAQVAKYWLSV